MWSDGVNVQAIIYNGPSSIEAEAIERYAKTSIELKQHLPFPEEVDSNKYVIMTSVERCAIPNGKHQVVMKGVIRENANE